MRKTNIEKIKETAIRFLHLPYECHETLPPQLHVFHPFLSSSVIMDRAGKMHDLEKEPECLCEYQDMMEGFINESDIYQIYYVLISKPYCLAFLKYTMNFLSEKDLAEILACTWVSVENPNQDANCSLKYLIKIFRKCDKKHLMTKEDYAVYDNLPETFTIYRGVSVGHNPKGLSWTRSLKTAQWFADRFNLGEEKGYIQTAVAKKENVLAYFNTRNEDEIVYDTTDLVIERLG